jgi:hypothetical protein
MVSGSGCQRRLAAGLLTVDAPEVESGWRFNRTVDEDPFSDERIN